jgi:hypothetical protein
MSNVRSAVDTFGVSSDEIVRDVSKLYLARPNEYALVAMVHSQGLEYQKEPDAVNVVGKPMGAEVVYNPKFEQHIDEIESDETAVNNGAGYADSDTSIVVDDGALVPKNALIYVPRTGEIFRVTSVSSHTLTVTRGESGTTAAALVDNDTLIIQGSAYAENALSGDSRFPQTAFTYNYTQIVREPFGESRTSAGTRYYNNAQSYDRRKGAALVSMLRRWNGSLWLGGRDIDTTNKFRTSGGVLEFVDSGNVMDVNQNLTKADFDYFLSSYAFAYNSNKKTLFAGKRLLNKIDGWYESKLVLTEQGKMIDFGFAVRTYKTRFGDLDIVWEPYFDKMTVGTNPLNSYGVVLDLSLLKIKYLSNGVLKSRDDIQENDRDGRKGEWLMEVGLAVNVQKAHAIIRGV